jgi:hypothetical protein
VFACHAEEQDVILNYITHSSYQNFPTVTLVAPPDTQGQSNWHIIMLTFTRPTFAYGNTCKNTLIENHFIYLTNKCTQVYENIL